MLRGRLRRIRRSLIDVLGALTIRCAWLLLRAVPLRYAQMLGAAFGRLAYYVYPTRRRIAFQNICSSIGKDWRRNKSRKLVRDSFASLGRLVFEFLSLPSMSKTRLQRLVTVPDADKRLFSEAVGLQRGVIVVMPHSGNWEICATALLGFGVSVSGVVRPQNHRRVNNLIVRTRKDLGFKVLYQPVTWVVRVRGKLMSFRDHRLWSRLGTALRRGEVVVLVTDQDAGSRGETIEFLGLPASTARGPAILARRYEAPVIAACPVRTRDGRFRLSFEKVCCPGDGSTERDVLVRISALFSQFIRCHPEQWMWSHRRWSSTRRCQERILLSSVTGALDAGRTVEISPLGGSMKPLIKSREKIVIAPMQKLSTGDVLLVRSREKLKVHRLVRVLDDGRIQTKGDCCPHEDEPVMQRRAVGKVVAVWKPGGMLALNSPSMHRINGALHALSNALGSLVRTIGFLLPFVPKGAVAWVQWVVYATAYQSVYLFFDLWLKWITRREQSVPVTDSASRRA